MVRLLLFACGAADAPAARGDPEPAPTPEDGASPCRDSLECVDPEVRSYLESRFYEGNLTIGIEASRASCVAALQIGYLARMRIGPLERVNRRAGLYYGAGSVVGVRETVPGCWSDAPAPIVDAADAALTLLRFSDERALDGSFAGCGTARLAGSVSDESIELRMNDADAGPRGGTGCEARCAEAGFTCQLTTSTASLQRVPSPGEPARFLFGLDDANGGY